MIVDINLENILKNLVNQKEKFIELKNELDFAVNESLINEICKTISYYNSLIEKLTISGLCIVLGDSQKINVEQIFDLYSDLDLNVKKIFTLDVVDSKKNRALEVSDINEINATLLNFIQELEGMSFNIKDHYLFKQLEDFRGEQNRISRDFETVKTQLNVLKNLEVLEIFKVDYQKFKISAILYEIAFYILVFFAAFYFLGLSFYIVDFDSKYLSISFPEKIHGNISAEFYIQKISFLVLSTTLAAFLLKRSLMNRRLADEAYRTAKELDALPRYMEGMPDEMKEKIRFDLAYKYFGNGIHHDSYTGGENLMHENIKANTEFMKIVKGVPSTTDETKADKDKNE